MGRSDGPEAIVLRNVSRFFGAQAAVEELSLEIGRGEFFSLLGPSGCSKTTTLRLIAGFERPDAGRVLLASAALLALASPPRHRQP